MLNFLSPVSLELNHVQIIVRGMHKVARADGEHEAELVLMKEFYQACREDVRGIADYKDVVAVEFDAADAKDILDTQVLQETFLKSCILLAYADGRYSSGEREVIGKMAEQIGIDQQSLDQVEEMVKEFLLRQIARLQNIDSIREVAAELDS